MTIFKHTPIVLKTTNKNTEILTTSSYFNLSLIKSVSRRVDWLEATILQKSRLGLNVIGIMGL